MLHWVHQPARLGCQQPADALALLAGRGSDPESHHSAALFVERAAGATQTVGSFFHLSCSAAAEARPPPCGGAPKGLRRGPHTIPRNGGRGHGPPRASRTQVPGRSVGGVGGNNAGPVPDGVEMPLHVEASTSPAFRGRRRWQGTKQAAHVLATAEAPATPAGGGHKRTALKKTAATAAAVAATVRRGAPTTMAAQRKPALRPLGARWHQRPLAADIAERGAMRLERARARTRAQFHFVFESLLMLRSNSKFFGPSPARLGRAWMCVRPASA